MRQPTRMIAGFGGAAVIAATAVLPAAATAPSSARTNAEAQADLRNLATVEETYLTDYDRYGGFRQLARGEREERFHVSAGIALAIVHVDGNYAYCLSAEAGSTQYMYDSEAGGLYPGNQCKATTHGRFGGIRRGPTYVG